jgi:hypothetical protein
LKIKSIVVVEEQINLFEITTSHRILGDKVRAIAIHLIGKRVIAIHHTLSGIVDPPNEEGSLNYLKMKALAKLALAKLYFITIKNGLKRLLSPPF